jgi:glucans biosynthesis protein
MNRRDFGRLLALGALASLDRSALADQTSAFSHEAVIALARQLAGEDFRPVPETSAKLRDLDYDGYRDIRYRSDAQLWRGEDRGFTADLLSTGFVFRHNIQIYLVEDGLARRIPFDAGRFDYGPRAEKVRKTDRPGFSGFRLRSAINNDDYLDEFAVFQGATYFRAVGQGQNYGLSARGLSIGTAEPKGEEFPVFRTFWIERPKKYAKSVTVHALLDCPSVTGAYQFHIMPGLSTRVEVDATLFARRDLDKLGVAPLTSMFLFDPMTKGGRDDFRTAVHDSDGLYAKRNTGELIWRPLRNPRKLELSFFSDTDPAGFGLMQRSRDIADFNDLEAHYEKRPCAWIAPKGKWGKGEVVLVEIPTDLETNDNIVAFWRPAETLKAGSSLKFGYWLTWGPPPSSGALAHVVSTRSGLALHSEGRVFIVDFAPGPQARDALLEGIDARVWVSKGEVMDVVGQFDAATNRYRLSFRLQEKGEELIEIGAVLRKAGQPASETWLYRWTRK